MACGLRKGAGGMHDSSICSGCPGMYELIRLIDCLVKDIRHLESEVVRTRYELSRHLPHPYDEELRGDIVSDLAGRYSDDPAYQLYMKLMYDIGILWSPTNGPVRSTAWLMASMILNAN